MNAVLNSNDVLGWQSLAYSDGPCVGCTRSVGTDLLRPAVGQRQVHVAPRCHHGQTVTHDLDFATVPTAVIHRWLELLHSASAPDPAAMAVARRAALPRHVSD
jgi:hypothetical protein